MGRSSNSSHYQLSTNKLISRVHVRAVYIATTMQGESRKVQIECTGWNGCKVHCQNRAWDLMKGDTFTSETEDADIMVDVQDARVLLKWPQLGEGKVLTPTDTDGSSWDGENNSPQRRAAARVSRGGGQGTVYTSPLRQQHRLQSPISPTPAVQATHAAASGFLDSNPPQSVPVKVYEDEPSDGEKDKDEYPTQQTQISTQIASQNIGPFEGLKAIQGLQKASQDTTTSSALSEPLNDFSDNDEENDPIISSFGPFGANLHARMENVNTFSPSQGQGPNSSPEQHRRPLQPLKEESISPQRPTVGASPSNKRRRLAQHPDVSSSAASSFSDQQTENNKKITNHITNQLAYSALSATPLSTLMDGIPDHLKWVHGNCDSAVLHVSMLESIINATACIGTVERSGKDAAGKYLESEFYYIPERDADEKRREVVLGLGGRGLRECRKIHKVCSSLSPRLCLLGRGLMVWV